MTTYTTDEWNYQQIKELAKIAKQSPESLIALSGKNDPFYAGSPADKRNAEWFANLWNEFGFQGSAGVHVRRLHYRIISNSEKVLMPNGEAYENTDLCWDFISQASKMARYLELVDPEAFVDRRNPVAVSYLPYQNEIELSTSRNLWGDLALPSFPDIPDYQLYGFEGRQPYHLELWAEKSTMNDVLLPLANDFYSVLQTGLGELSISAVLEFIKRVQKDGRPTRVFYISDFDPAGKSMPVAVARKIEYYLRKYGIDLDVRLYPVVLTEDQVRDYGLPRTPIKDTEKRKDKFEARFGADATELDALEAIRPGELDRILRRYLRSYQDRTLEQRVRDERQRLRNQLEATRDAVLDEERDDDRDDGTTFRARASVYEQRYALLKDEFERRASELNEHISDLWREIDDELQAAKPNVEDYPIPEANLIDEDEQSAMFSSTRDYLEQIGFYKRFQGK